MTAKMKMIEIVGKAIVKVLDQHSDKQPNLASDTTRYKIASDILDEVLIYIDNPNFKKAK